MTCTNTCYHESRANYNNWLWFPCIYWIILYCKDCNCFPSIATYLLNCNTVQVLLTREIDTISNLF